MANKVSLSILLLLLELSALQAQFPPRRFRRPFQFRPFNGRAPPFGPRPFPPPNFRFQGIPQNGFNPFVQNRMQSFPNGITNDFSQQQVTDTNDPPPVMVTGTVDPRRIANVMSRFQLPTGPELFRQMSSPPEEETNTFAGTGGATNSRTTGLQNTVSGMQNTIPGIQNTIPGMQNTFPGMRNAIPGMPLTVPVIQNGFDRINTAPRVNGLNNNFAFQNGLNRRINQNSLIPRVDPRTAQGFRQTQLTELNRQNQLTRTNRVTAPRTFPTTFQEPILVTNPSGMQTNRDQLLRNQRTQNVIRNPGLESQRRNAELNIAANTRSIDNIRVPAQQITVVPTVPPTQPPAPNIVDSASAAQENSGQEGMVPIWPGIPGIREVPAEAVKSNATMDYVEIITISDADGNVYYQGLNSTDSDHRRIQNILDEIQRNQTEEAHRRGKAGLSTIPDTGNTIPASDQSTSGTGQGDPNAASGGSGSQSGNITVMDENNNILYQGPELPDAELQARIRATLETQERQKIMLAEQAASSASGGNSGSSSSSGTQPEVTTSQPNTLSRDQNRFGSFGPPVGFNPLSIGFDPNRFSPSRGIDSRFPESFNPRRERFSLRQNSIENSLTRTRGINTGVSNANSVRTGNNLRSNSRMRSENNISPVRGPSSVRERQREAQMNNWFQNFFNVPRRRTRRRM